MGDSDQQKRRVFPDTCTDSCTSARWNEHGSLSCLVSILRTTRLIAAHIFEDDIGAAASLALRALVDQLEARRVTLHWATAMSYSKRFVHPLLRKKAGG